MIRALVWNEHLLDADPEHPASAVYPDGIHSTIAKPLPDAGFAVRTATLNEPEHGLTEAALDETDVLVWWGHKAHHRVEEAITARVHQRVRDGMGFIALRCVPKRACWYRENGRVFYFRPGHETYPIYHQPEVQHVPRNAIRWVAAGAKAQPVRVVRRDNPLNPIHP